MFMYPFPFYVIEQSSKQKDEFLQVINHMQCGYYFVYSFLLCKAKKNVLLSANRWMNAQCICFFLDSFFSVLKIIWKKNNKKHTCCMHWLWERKGWARALNSIVLVHVKKTGNVHLIWRLTDHIIISILKFATYRDFSQSHTHIQIYNAQI